MSSDLGPVSQTTDNNKDVRYIIVSVMSFNFNELYAEFYNEETLEEIGFGDLDPINYFDNLSFRGNIKAVVFEIWRFKHPKYSNNINYCLMVAEKLTKQKILFNFVNMRIISQMKALLYSNVDFQMNETLVTIFPVFEKVFYINKLCRNLDGYCVIKSRFINENDFEKYIKSKILESCIPKWIIILNPSKPKKDEEKFLRENALLKSNEQQKLIDLTSMYLDEAKIILAFSKRMNDPNFNKFHIIRQCEYNFIALRNIAKFDLRIHIFENLPISSSLVVTKSIKRYSIYSTDGGWKGLNIITKYNHLEANHHRIEITLKVDENNLPSLVQKHVILSEIQAMPQTLNSKTKMNIPIMGLFDNSSVICVSGENGYNFLKSWNGMYGNDLYLSFDQGNPRFIPNILETQNIPETFLVYDFVKILSMPPNNFIPNDEWEFEVTEDKENPILIQFKTFHGIQKEATPNFLMALILKHHVKAIKAEIGQKPNEIGFCILNNEYSTEEINNIKNGLDEACTRLKIKSIFIDNL